MDKWKFSFPIYGLHDVIQQNVPKKGPSIKIDEVLFHYREDNERVGTVIIEANTMEEAEKESQYLIDKALGKICFAFNTETFSQQGHSRENPNSIVYKRSADD